MSHHLGELSPTTSNLFLCETMSSLRHYLLALLPLPARSWDEAVVMWQVGRLRLFPFPGYAHLECGQVWSGCQVWYSGSVAELVALRDLGVSFMPVLTFLFALPPCKVSLPSDLLCNARASWISHPLSRLWSFPHQTFWDLVFSRPNLCRFWSQPAPSS